MTTIVPTKNGEVCLVNSQLLFITFDSKKKCCEYSTITEDDVTVITDYNYDEFKIPKGLYGISVTQQRHTFINLKYIEQFNYFKNVLYITMSNMDLDEIEFKTKEDAKKEFDRIRESIEKKIE